MLALACLPTAGRKASVTLLHILAVDDDESIRALLSDYLGEQGYQVTAVGNGREMRKCLAEATPDLVILDVKMPGEDGFALAQEIRQTSAIPIIMLTGEGHEVDRVLGLELGADDYLTKPFSPRELLARIKAVLRRYADKKPVATAEPLRRETEIRVYKFAGWELSTGTRRLKSPKGERIELTNGEYSLLMTFLRAPQQILSRDQLLNASRLHDDVYDRSIDVQILRLRRKVEPDPNEPKLIRTERGAGYIFACDVE